jgi:ribosomal protein S18 acetylase RimI-like enzyme
VTDIHVRSEERPELDKRLGDGLYEFNSTTTGIYDGELFNASIEDDDGEIVAGISGHTWGESCEVTRLWVHESLRGRGIGTRLLQAAENEARRRGCRQIVLSTHSFQAPLFYEGLGFKRLATIPNYPKGHEQYVYLKSLVP